MDATELRRPPDPGFLGCDRELFAQVWSRVDKLGTGPVEPNEAPQCPLTPVGAPDRRETEDAKAGEACTRAGERDAKDEDGQARDLQELVRECLLGAAVYRRAAGHSRRNRGELTALARQKDRAARRASAACFLMTGVRYFPVQRLGNVRGGLLGLLRERFEAERRLERRLRDWERRAGDPMLQELYHDLADETAQAARRVRTVVEREA